MATTKYQQKKIKINIFDSILKLLLLVTMLLTGKFEYSTRVISIDISNTLHVIIFNPKICKTKVHYLSYFCFHC